MIFFFYGVWLLGVLFLVLDAGGRFRTSSRRARVLRLVGLSALAIPAIVPLAAVYGRWWQWSGDVFPVIAHSYTVLAGIYVTAVVVGRGALARWVSRLAYFCLLVLSAIPSFVLLPIAGPTIGLAGLALARTAARTRVHDPSAYQASASGS